MFDWLAQQALRSPRKTALIHADRVWTYADLNQRVAQVAAWLSFAGVQRGDHVAALMPNRPELVMVIHALARMGAVMVPLNARLTDRELRWQVDHANCALIIGSRETQTQVAMLATHDRRALLVEQADEPVPHSEDGGAGELDLDAIQGIVFTSGTTGHPRGAMLTFANHLWSATASAYHLSLLPEDRWLACMPLAHVGGQAIVLRSCLYGIAMVLHSGFDAATVSRALDQEGITLVSLVPTMLHRLLDQRGDRPFPPSLRCILLGGAAAPEPLLERCRALGLPVAATYGLTEAASQVATATPGDRSGSVGKPLMFVDTQILDADGEALPPGRIGEIAIRGPMVMRGYYDDLAATQKVLHEGRLYTGDLGYLDEEGNLYVMQRRTDLIISGGENVYPAEVETVLLAHPAVCEACVIGMTDAEWGQRVAALVVRRDGALTEETLMDFCRERLAGYKLPRLIRFIEALPQTASGKVSRQVARALIEETTIR